MRKKSMASAEEFIFVVSLYWVLGFIPIWFFTILAGRKLFKFVYLKLAASLVALLVGAYLEISTINFSGHGSNHYFGARNFIAYFLSSLSILIDISVYFQKTQPKD
jgi:uncharacterized PurR-regulated membrane protein YhhQ (DUF165 family)